MYAVKDDSDCLQLFFPLDYCGILRPLERGLQLYLLSFVGFLEKHMWSGRAFSVQKSVQCEVSSRWAKRDPVASSFFLGSCLFLSEELTLMVSICLRRPRLFEQHCFHCSGLGQGKLSVRVVLYQKRQCIASCFLGQNDYCALFKSLCYFSFK